jgi:hypothetical protein
MEDATVDSTTSFNWDNVFPTSCAITGTVVS